MAQFYGSLNGSRGEVTRLGTKSSGLRTVAASWAGAVEVNLYERDGIDYARVALKPWRGYGVQHELYDGPVNGAAAPAK